MLIKLKQRVSSYGWCYRDAPIVTPKAGDKTGLHTDDEAHQCQRIDWPLVPDYCVHRAQAGQKETFDEQGRIADNPPSEQMHGALDLASKGYATKLQTA